MRGHDRILACAALVLLSALGCRGPQIEVVVSGLTPDVRSLSVVAMLRDRLDSRSVQAVRDRLDSFLLLHVPQGGGDLELVVAGLSADGCRLSQGMLRQVLPPGASGPIRVALTRQAAPGCRIQVQLVGQGKGQVVSEPPGISCPGSCEATFPLGSQVRLRAAAADERSYFTGWSGPCAGLGICELSVGDDAARLGAGFLPAQVCGGAFCWEAPLPHGNVVRGLWVRSASDVWAVGAGGLVLRWFGSFWAPIESGTSAELRAVFSRGSEIWIVGDGGTVLRADLATGGALQRVAVPAQAALRAVAGDAAAIWIAGDGGTVLRMDGDHFAAVPGAPARDLYGLLIGGAETWAVGDGGTVLRWDGAALRPIAAGTTARLRAVFGRSEGEVVIAGDGGTMLRWDGSALRGEDARTTADLYALWGSPSATLWAAGAGGTLRSFDAGAWRSVSAGSQATLQGLSGSAPGDAWAGGEGGEILRWNGALWAPQRTADREPLVAVGRGDGGGVVAVSRSGVLRQRVGGVWHGEMAGPGFFFEDAATAPGEVWGVGASGVIAQLARETASDSPRWFVLLGPALMPQLPRLNLHGVWRRGASAASMKNDVWVVGDSGLICHVEGTLARPAITSACVAPYPQALRSIFWVSATEGWTVGDQGTALHFVGDTLFRSTSGTSERLLRVFGASADDVWAVGERGVILHWNGAAWSAIPSGTTASLRALWAAGKTEAWAAGDGGVVLRWDGTRWAAVDARTSTDFAAATGGVDGKLFLVGSSGAVLSGDRAALP